MYDILLILFTSVAGAVDQMNQLVPWLVQSSDGAAPVGIDMSIEGLRSHGYSIGIFVFLIVSLVVFSAIIYIYLPKGDKRLKRGEKVMFGAIILGMVFAVIMGWLQLIEGYLL